VAAQYGDQIREGISAETKRGPGVVTAAANSTARSRHCRARRRAGKLQLTIEADEAGLEALLAHHGLLPNCGSDDRHAITRALEELIRLLIEASAAQRYG
jgi:hypothetical protein